MAANNTMSRHDKLSYNGNFIFEDFSTPEIVFTEFEVVIDGKSIGRDAFEELHRRYQEFLKPAPRRMVVQEDGCSPITGRKI